MNEEQEKIERRWRNFQEHQGYTDEQIKIFRSDPVRVKAMERAPMFVTHYIVAECVESNNCNAGHKVGDRIVFHASGVLMSELSPKRMCAHALQAIASPMYGIFERIYENLDGSIIFWRVGCPDVGVEKGGWGHTEWKIYTEPIKKD